MVLYDCMIVWWSTNLYVFGLYVCMMINHFVCFWFVCLYDDQPLCMFLVCMFLWLYDDQPLVWFWFVWLYDDQPLFYVFGFLSEWQWKVATSVFWLQPDNASLFFKLKLRLWQDLKARGNVRIPNYWNRVWITCIEWIKLNGLIVINKGQLGEFD